MKATTPWHAASFRQRTYAPPREMSTLVIGKPIASLGGDYVACKSCGYLECCCHSPLSAEAAITLPPSTCEGCDAPVGHADALCGPCRARIRGQLLAAAPVALFGIKDRSTYETIHAAMKLRYAGFAGELPSANTILMGELPSADAMAEFDGFAPTVQATPADEEHLTQVSKDAYVRRAPVNGVFDPSAFALTPSLSTGAK